MIRLAFVGIDPGVGGAIAIYDDTAKQLSIFDSPVGDDDRIDFIALFKLVKRELMLFDSAVAVIEWPRAVVIGHHLGKQNGKMATMAGFQGLGISMGAWMAALAQYDIVPTRANPQTWKRTMGVTADKQTSYNAALARFPWAEKLLIGPRGGKKMDRAEALLLMEYARLNYKLEGNLGR